MIAKRPRTEDVEFTAGSRHTVQLDGMLWPGGNPRGFLLHEFPQPGAQPVAGMTLPIYDTDYYNWGFPGEIFTGRWDTRRNALETLGSHGLRRRGGPVDLRRFQRDYADAAVRSNSSRNRRRESSAAA